MRRKRSQSPLTPGGAMSPHRTTRASSRSPRTPGSKAIITPTSESPKSTKCELNGHISTHLRPRQTSNSPNKLSPHDVNSLKDTSNSYRRSSRVNRGLDYHKSESEDNDNEGHNSEHETRTRSLRKDRSKRENLESRTSSCKRARREERSTHDHSFVTSDEDDETGGRESPFLNHVRFSPSAKMGSPARSRDLRQLTPASKNNITSRRSSRAAADVARIRLQNVPSEDEQFEFNRRYSRDLRQRKGAARKNFSDVDGERGDDNAISPTRTTRLSPRRAQGRTSPMPTADLRSRRGRHSTLNAETKIASEEEIHNASKEEAETMARSFLQEIVLSVGKKSNHKDTNKELEDAGEADDESQQSDEDCKESKRSTRTKLARELSGEDETKKCPSSASPIRRSSRRRGSVDYVSKRNRNTSMTEDDEKAEKDDEDTPIRSSRRIDRKSDQRNENDSTNWVRRSSRQPKSTASDGNEAELEGCLSDGTHHSPENGVRRSKREHHKPSFYDPVAYEKQQSSSDDEDEEEDEEEEEDDNDDDEEEDKPIHRSQRRKSKRRRRSVERFAYEPPEPIRRRSGREHRRSQFSSDEEFQRSRGESNRSRRRSSQRRRPTNMNRMRDTSSSSSEDEMEKRDEASFQKRKTKRMNIERSKLLPLNFGKSDAAQSIFRERSKAGASLADISPMEIDMNVTFESIGGLDEHVDKLREMIMFPLLYGEFFKKYNTNPPKGVLFYGPPGTGKTMMARALACECSQENRKVAFFMRKGADCLSKWIGESERQLRLLFDQAYQMRPSIIFFDEIDGLAPVRSSRQDQIHSSIVSTLLALMDGLDDRGEVIIIGATNRIENIDPALRRPGRFDRELRFALPTQAARNDILALSMKKWTPPISSDLINLLSEKTIGYCGADLKGLCAEAPLNALRRRYPHVYKTNQKLALNLDEIIVTDDDFFKAMKSIVPSTHRIQDQYQCPLPPEIRPLLQATVGSICQIIEKIMPKHQYGSSSNEQLGSYYRPRLLIKGNPKQGLTTYIGPAILHAFETLPCHKLDITSLFSNAARSPEEALFHVIHEARKTIPSILYIPHFMKLWSNVMTGIHSTLKEALISLLSDIPPSAPLLILAIAEYADVDENADSYTALNLFNQTDQVLTMQNPSEEERKTYFKPIFEAARRPPPQIEETTNVHVNEALRIVPVADTRKLTEKEEKRLRRKEDALMRELRIFLRDIHQKINKEPKFFMFRVPVDTEECHDYLQIIKQPMDFETMQTKIDKNEYSCAKEYLDDMDLIANNAIEYNDDITYETNRIINHRAKNLQDFAYALISSEMDTDFEEECKEVVDRRQKLSEELQKPTIEAEPEFFSFAGSKEVVCQSEHTVSVLASKKPGKKRCSTFGKRVKRARNNLQSKRDIVWDYQENDNSEHSKNVNIEIDDEITVEGVEQPCIVSNTPAKSTQDNAQVFHVDEDQLLGLEKNLHYYSHDMPIEDLQNLSCKLTGCVRQFTNQHNRDAMIKTLEKEILSVCIGSNRVNIELPTDDILLNLA